MKIAFVTDYPGAPDRVTGGVESVVARLATAMAKLQTRSNPDAVREALDAYEELGVEEVMLNTATAEMAEIDGLLEVMEKRG